MRQMDKAARQCRRWGVVAPWSSTPLMPGHWP
jgi:hypothetical protein